MIQEKKKTLRVKATVVYDKTVEEKDRRIIVHQGASRSSKTWSIFQYFIFKAMAGERFVLTIARSKLTWVKSTLLKDFEELIRMYGFEKYLNQEINPNRPEQVYKLNGSEFAFFGLDYPQKLHGRKQDYAWLNEIMEVDKRSFDQIEMRTERQLILDFNPAFDDHWVYELEKRPDVVFIHSSFLDNPFLEERIRDKIKSYEPTKENLERGTADTYMWEVYGLGRKARLQGAVYTNWELVEGVPEDAELLGLGLDFGFTNDPTAVVELYRFNGELYINELIYESGLLNRDIANKLRDLGIKNELIIADSAEPKSIEELKREGFNIEGAIKGAGSVKYRIDLLKQYRMNITKKSANIESELRKYKWREDRLGKALNEPVDEFNHGLDALGYISSKKLRREPSMKELVVGSDAKNVQNVTIGVSYSMEDLVWVAFGIDWNNSEIVGVGEGRGSVEELKGFISELRKMHSVVLVGITPEPALKEVVRSLGMRGTVVKSSEIVGAERIQLLISGNKVVFGDKQPELRGEMKEYLYRIRNKEGVEDLRYSQAMRLAIMGMWSVASKIARSEKKGETEVSGFLQGGEESANI